MFRPKQKLVSIVLQQKDCIRYLQLREDFISTLTIPQFSSQTIIGLFFISTQNEIYQNFIRDQIFIRDQTFVRDQNFIRDQISPKKQDDTLCPILEGLF